MAAPTYVAAGSDVTGTTSLSVPYPTGRAAGDLLVLAVSYKYGGTATVVTPSGFTAPANNQAQGGSGTGVDIGVGAVAVFYRIADGTESGNLSVTVTSGNGSVGQMYAYRTPKVPATWDIACVTANDEIGGTSWSAAAAADYGIVSGEDELVLACSGINTNSYAWSAQLITQAGVTFGAATERVESGSTQGDDLELVVSEHPVTSGSSAGNPTYTMTASGGGAENPMGGTVLLRMRALNAGDDINLLHTEAVVATQGGSPNILLGQTEVSAAMQGGVPEILLHGMEVLVATTDRQNLTGTTSLDFGAVTGVGGELESGLQLTGVAGLDFGWTFGNDGSLYPVAYLVGGGELEFGMAPNPSGAVEAAIDNDSVLYRLDPNAPGPGKISERPLWRQVDRIPTPYTIVVSGGVARRVRFPSSDLDPDTVYLGGHVYEILDTHPHYAAFVAAGIAMEEIG